MVYSDSDSLVVGHVHEERGGHVLLVHPVPRPYEFLPFHLLHRLFYVTGNKTPFCPDDESGAEGRPAAKMLLYFQRLFPTFVKTNFFFLDFSATRCHRHFD